MELKVFSIYDNAVKAYNQPFFMLTQAEAVRAFSNLLKDINSSIAQNPQDYVLYKLGTYDNQTGMFTQDKSHTRIGSANEFNVEVLEEKTA